MLKLILQALRQVFLPQLKAQDAFDVQHRIELVNIEFHQTLKPVYIWQILVTVPLNNFKKLIPNFNKLLKEDNLNAVF